MKWQFLKAFEFTRSVVVYAENEEQARINIDEVLEEQGTDLQDSSNWDLVGLVPELGDIEI